MARTKRGLKRKHSQNADVMKESRFTTIVNKQECLCWYCNEYMGVECSKEHLLSQVLGGTNDSPPGNLKAACRDCNSAVGHLPVADKYRLREIARSEGRQAFFIAALQMRRADTRLAFSTPCKPKLSKKERSQAYWRKLGLCGKPDWWQDV